MVSINRFAPAKIHLLPPVSEAEGLQGNLRGRVRGGENSGTYAEHRGAFFKGDGVVMTHPHGEMPKMGYIGEKVGAEGVKEGTEETKLLSYTFGVIGKRSHTHEAVDTDRRVFFGTENPKQGLALLRGKSMFGGFLCEVELEQDADQALVFAGLPVYFPEEIERVYTVNGMDKGGDQFYFVGLESPDEMPFYVGRELPLFKGKFPGAVLPEKTLAGVIGLAERFHRLILGNGDEADLVGNIGTEATEVFSDRHEENS
jgi:hypothetical protein